MTKNTKRHLVPVAHAHNSYNQFFKPTFWAITLVLGVTIPVALLPTFIVSAIFYFATGVANRESFAGAFLLGTRKDADVKTTLIGLGGSGLPAHRKHWFPYPLRLPAARNLPRRVLQRFLYSYYRAHCH